MADNAEANSKQSPPNSVSDPDTNDDSSNSNRDTPHCYSTDPAWQDVVPIEQKEGEFPVVRINYSKEFKEVHDYLRALLKTSEVSERALSLTSHAVDLNPANYTTWQYRRIVLKGLNVDLEKEMKYVAGIIENNPKNYQVWYHRQKLTEWKNEPGIEFEFTAECLVQDAKNYHVWQYRQWLLERFPDFYGKELEYVDSLIKTDVRNNSAWNQRYFVLSKTAEFTPELVRKEIEYTKLCIRLTLHNESPWNYMRGILNGQDLKLFIEVKNWVLELISRRNASIFALSFLVDACEVDIEEGGKERCQNSLDEALGYCQKLGEEIDVIRRNYWKYTGDRLKMLARDIHGIK